MTRERTLAAGRNGQGTLAEPQVRAMFDRIAGVYDRLNTVMTAGLHHHWRRRAAELAAVAPGERALDVATGTGDLAFALARASGPSGEVVGADFSEQMLEIARAKAAGARRAVAAAVRFEQANALALPHADDEFDAATVGFGVRNFSDLDQGLREMARVVRPGRPRGDPRDDDAAAAAALDVLQAVVRPGRAGARPARRRLRGLHLPARTRCGGFPGPRSSPRGWRPSGLRDIRYVLTAGGIIALHVGTVVA